MSVLIKGIEMPNVCAFCFLDAGECNLHAEVNIWRERHPDCPLVELPPHGRLIDANEIEMPCLETTADQKWMEIAIKSTPTIIEAEGREE